MQDKILKKDPESICEIENKEYYITDGIFCSFNCCLAFIKDNWYNSMYSNSETLLNQIYNKLFNNTQKFLEAPSWRLLKDYGGGLTIQEFRQSFNKIEYIDNNDYLIEYPKCKPCGFIFEKKIKF